MSAEASSTASSSSTTPSGGAVDAPTAGGPVRWAASRASARRDWLRRSATSARAISAA
ncbi:hypothetical protein ACFQ1I_21180 [Kitasatospora arboriphila]